MSAWTFFREFVRDPMAVGAVAPSSAALAQSMVTSADLRPGQVVVEVGPGTGPFTEALLAARPGEPLLCLEPAETLAAALRERCPEAEVMERMVQDLPGILADKGWGRADRIVSGLPLTLWDKPTLEAVYGAMVDSLKPDGRMVTFSYVVSQMMPNARRMRAELGRYFGKVTTSPITWANIPPALVFIAEEPHHPES